MRVCLKNVLDHLVAESQNYLEIIAMVKTSYEFLFHYGYLNFRCLGSIVKWGWENKLKTRKCVIVIGSGIAGLGCARQLVNLFRQCADRFPKGTIPEVIVLEGRDRIGGRTNSRRLVPSPIADGSKSSLSSITSSPTKVSPVFDVGARFIHGVVSGDPLVHIIKHQLKLELSQVSNDRLLLSDASSRKHWDQENVYGYH